MAKFLIGKTIAARKKDQKFFWFYAFLCVALLVQYCIFYPDTSLPVWAIFFTAAGAITSYRGFKNMGKVKFAEIGPDTVEWRIHDRNASHILLNWNGIEWLKKENNGDISFYMASSFCYSLPVAQFLKEDQEKLVGLAINYAQQHNIRLVNFLEPALAPA
jgi:hypothetical protein